MSEMGHYPAMRRALPGNRALWGKRLLAAGLAATLPTPVLAGSAETLSATTAQDAPTEAPARVIFGRALDLTGQAPVVSRPVPAPVARGTTLSGKGVRPTAITSGFGMRRHPILGQWRSHLGVDMAAPSGSPVLSPGAGTVRSAGWQGGYGLTVTVEHANGIVTRYAHLSGVAVSSGQRIGKGAVIGLVGSTGRSTGAHLHYETWVNGQPVNPLGK